MKFYSQYIRSAHHVYGLALRMGWWVFMIGANGCIDNSLISGCDPFLGECPAPEPGLLVNEINLEKSVWVETGEIGLPHPFYSQLCRADARRANGIEVIVHGMEGIAVIEHAEGKPTRTVHVPWHDTGFASVLTLHDLDGDGATEYVGKNAEITPFNTEFYASDGSLILSYPTFQTGFEIIDVYGDGERELVIQDLRDDRSSIWNLNGDRIFTAAVLGSVSSADLDADGDLEIIVQRNDSSERFATISSWELDGTSIGTFQTEESGRVFVAASAEDPERHLIGFDCKLYSPSGHLEGEADLINWLPVQNGITTTDPDSEGLHNCPGFEFGDFRLSDYETEINQDCNDDMFDEFVTFVQFRPTDRPYRIKFSYSVNVTEISTGFESNINYEVNRTILRVFNTNNRLVHHEVLASNCGRGSFSIIESAENERQILLVSDGEKIWSYHLPN